MSEEQEEKLEDELMGLRNRRLSDNPDEAEKHEPSERNAYSAPGSPRESFSMPNLSQVPPKSIKEPSE